MRRFLLEMVLAVGILVLALLIAVQSVAYDANYIAQELLRLGSPEVLALSNEDVYRYARHTTAYLRGATDDPNLVLNLDGQARLFLNEREVLHMDDVQHLFTLARYGVGVLGVLLFIWGWSVRWRQGTRVLLKSVALGVGFAFLIGALLALLVSQDFNRSFTLFHVISFSNDLWQLDPATDLLINLLPEQFFANAAWRTTWRAVGLLLLLGISSLAAFKVKNDEQL